MGGKRTLRANVDRRVGECVKEGLRIANLQSQLRFPVINRDIVPQTKTTEPPNVTKGAKRNRAFKSVYFRQEHEVERKLGDDRQRRVRDNDEQTVARPTS